jgi:hypothetical protein
MPSVPHIVFGYHQKRLKFGLIGASRDESSGLDGPDVSAGSLNTLMVTDFGIAFFIQPYRTTDFPSSLPRVVAQ